MSDLYNHERLQISGAEQQQKNEINANANGDNCIEEEKPPEKSYVGETVIVG